MELFCAGARVERIIAMGPVAGTGANITAMSYCGGFEIGMFIDPESITEPQAFRDHVEQAFADMFAAVAVQTLAAQAPAKQKPAVKKAAAKKPAARPKPAAKKPAKKAAKKPAKKAAAKKPVAKKPAAQKAAVKKTAAPKKPASTESVATEPVATEAPGAAPTADQAAPPEATS